jgi:hypothetical protein
MKFKAPAKYIDIDLPDGEVRRIRIPNGLGKATLPPGFVTGVIRVVAKHFDELSTDAGIKISTVETRNGDPLPLKYHKSNGVLYWAICVNGAYVAAGFFELALPYWQEVRAAALPLVRGQGLYKAVLRQLRLELRRRLVSDNTLSEANMLIWASIADVDDTLGRFRINPRRSQYRRASLNAAALSVARSIIAMEVA